MTSLPRSINRQFAAIFEREQRLVFVPHIYPYSYGNSDLCDSNNENYTRYGAQVCVFVFISQAFYAWIVYSLITMECV